ncbi:hypothetical protein [Nonomuraea longispora]|uniref:hypothetical protein n=1 Tax=Nonomuraea longispora TaxID=1848320 RepID=UPI00140545F4|nr:hypothetical protein [Nonomuraea longispora]
MGGQFAFTRPAALHAHAPGENLRETASSRCSKDELGGVDVAGEVEQRLRDVVAHDLVVGAAHALDLELIENPCGGLPHSLTGGFDDLDGFLAVDVRRPPGQYGIV